MNWLLPAVVATLTVACVLVLTFFLLFLAERQRYLVIWFAAWVAYAFRITSQLMLLLQGPSFLYWMGNQSAAIISGLLLLWGTHLFSRRKMHVLWVAGAVLCFLFLLVVHAYNLSFYWLAFPAYLYIGIAYIWTGKDLLVHSEFSRQWRRVAGWGFILGGVHMLNYPLVRPVDWLIPWGYLVSALLHMVIGLGLLYCYFDRVRRELANSEQRYRRVIEDQTEFILRIKPDGIITFVNHAYCRWRGVHKEELEGKSIWSLLPEETGKLLRGRIDLLTPDSQVHTGEFQWIGPDGSERWMSWTDRALFDKQGNLLEIQSVGRDIDEIKRANMQMVQLATALEQAVEAIFIAEIRNDKDPVIIHVNPAFEKLYQFDREEVIGKKVDAIMDRVAAGTDVRAEIEQALRKGDCWYGRVQNLRKDGTLFLKETVVSPVKNENGKIVGFVSIGRDVTREIDLEQQLIQSQKMEVVGRLAGGVAHDFNNLLNVINGYTEQCQQELPVSSPLQEYLEGILRTVESAALLTRQLLTFSRSRELKTEVVDLNRIIDNMQNILSPLVGKAIELHIELVDGLECIEADKTQIEQVVLNLVVNARDAVGENGAIKLRTLGLSGSETDSNGRVVLEVIDNGSGIRPEIAKRIFEPFFTTKGMDKGTGLGLSTVRNIVEKHGGTIQVDSQPGKGSCFRVEFPASNRTVLLEKN